MMLDTQRSPRTEVELIDTPAIVADLKALAKTHGGRERELRTAVALRLKSALTQARSRAEQLLLKDRHGRRCAERLCQLQDEIIRILFEFIGTEIYPPQVPSEAEHMAVVATGGYGRGLLAPGSDIDLLFLLPYKQTAWGESVAEALLYCLWDMGLKVGHATRSVSRMHSPGQGRHDHPHDAARIAPSARRRQALRGTDDALRQGSRAGHGAGIRRRQARRARGAPPPRRPVALSGRAQRQGRQGRPARPAHAVLDRQIRLPRARARGIDQARRVRPRRIHFVPPLRRLPVVGPLQHAFPRRPRRGAAVVRHPARYRGAARLHRASRPARRRALHEALLPHRQACRRSHRHPVRRPRGAPGDAGAGA